MEIFFYVLLLLAIIYAFFLLWCWRGWIKIKVFRENGFNKTSVSIIVPARNEEKNIKTILSDLIAQKFPKDLFEIIIIDDDSTDNTVEVVHEFIESNKDYRIHLLAPKTRLKSYKPLKGYLTGKKQAITEAINISSGELIITTDADCRVEENWLATVVSFYEKNDCSIFSCPVMFSSEKNWFEKIQSLEFIGLIAIGAGAIANREPILCNGANLAFQKDAFYKVNGYDNKRTLATGDDTQLLLKISKLNKNKIHFLKSQDAIATTNAEGSLKGLFEQRKRWASKIPLQMNAITVFMAVVAYLLNAGLIVGFIIILKGYYSSLFLFAFCIKLTAEILLLNSIASFMKKKNLLWLFLPAQIFYTCYIIIIGIASLVGKYEWKARSIKM